MTTPNTTRIWIAIQFSPSKRDQIRELQAQLTDIVPEGFAIEPDPHVSVIPSAVIPSQAHGDIKSTVEQHTTELDSIQTGELVLYPPILPYVVSLNVKSALHHIRSTLINQIYHLGGTLQYPPVDPHITLFKAGDDKQSSPRLRFSAYSKFHREIESFDSDSIPTNEIVDEIELTLREF